MEVDILLFENSLSVEFIIKLPSKVIVCYFPFFATDYVRETSPFSVYFELYAAYFDKMSYKCGKKYI